MVTTRRTSEEIQDKGNNAVDLLERREVGEKVQSTESLEQAKVRMRENLNRIMGYDKYSNEEKASSNVLVAEPEVEEKTNEDYEPSSTTLTFKDESISDVYAELNSNQEKEVHFSNKSKVLIAIVAVLASVMLALIVINASILANFTKANAETSSLLNGKIEQYNELKTQIDQVSSNENIINIAEDDFGMIKVA